jgi:hypothetical protein
MGHTAFVILAILMLLSVPLAGAALLAFNHGAAQADRQTYVIEPGSMRAID